MPQSVLDSLLDIFVTDLRLDPAGLRPECRLEEAGVDSLSLVELSIALRDRFGMEITEEELAGVTTVGGLEKLVTDRTVGR
ncbi:acyl carrier protein [Saccharopolyspora taberi]|uniref:Carrier domain-containing protein n=1 Tax=Saccharopolyspora taberi TaxID=60895 RepID=A0ABN3VFR8_9PSEU